MKRKAIPVSAVLALAVMLGCTPWVRPSLSPEPRVKVGLSSGVHAVVLSSNAPFTVRFGDNLARSNPGSRWHLRFAGDSLDVVIDDSLRVVGPTLPVVVHPESEGAVLIDGRPYRGDAEIRRNPDGSLLVVNALPLEYYLMGVVPCEIGAMPPRFFEALKAQAVAARSYALSRKGKRQGEGFELHATTADQVYGGQARETDITNRAVRETRGIVGTFDGRVIQANYSSTCGGIRAAGSDAWPGVNLPYLRGGYDRPAYQGCCLLGVPPLSWMFPAPSFCSNSPYYSWHKVIKRSDLYSVIAQSAPGRDSALVIYGIGYRKTNSRQGKLVARTSRGQVEISSIRLRSMLNLNSDFFTMKVGAGTVEIDGHGWGHGVGMCQYGALGMATKGYSFDKILKHYYHGIKLTRFY